MASSRYRFTSLIIAACAALVAAPRIAAAYVERGVAFIVGLIPTLASPPAFAFDGPAMAMDLGGRSIDPAVQNSLRHEAGMRELR